MTNPSETPARRAKRVRINKDNNEVEVIQVDSSESAPSIAARDHVKAAVASHPEAIQRIVKCLAKEFVSLKAKFQEKSKTKTKLDSDTSFIPRSAKVAFKLTAPASIMETTEFKTLSAAMDEKTTEYKEFCKKSIASVAALVNEGMKKDIADVFRKGLFQLCALLLTKQDPYRKIQPTEYFCLYLLGDLPPTIFDETYAKKSTLQTEFITKINELTDTPATQEQTLVIPPNLLGEFTLLQQDATKLLTIVFVESFARFSTKMKENDIKKSLERQATHFLSGDASTATAMEIDAEPSADPKIIRDFVNKAVQSQTSKLQAEFQKLRDSVKRPPSAKNSDRGARSSSTTQSAPSPKKKQGQSDNKKQETKKTEANNKSGGKQKQQHTPRKKSGKPENSGAPSGSDSPKGRKRQSPATGTPSKKKNAKNKRQQSKQS